MINESYIEFESVFDCSLKNLLLTHEQKPSSLVIFFPGSYYTCDHPILNYARMAVLFKGCDTLSLEYGFQRANKNFDFEDFEKTLLESCSIIEKCDLHSYSNIYFISKSIGTVFAGKVTELLSNLKIKNLFLTPTERTIPYILKFDCLAVTGSMDKAISVSSIDLLKCKCNEKLIVIPDADHGLETEISMKRNIEILEQVIKITENLVS
ncbi:MAG: hypothetical protein K0R71_2207 [Bacillales bacterium]|jgi:hypothetical protein|nr:hypothetical protein [Bacillales bacterium]